MNSILLKKTYFIIFNYAHIGGYVYLSVNAPACEARGVRSLRSGVSGSHEAANEGSGNRPWVLYKSSVDSSAFQLLNIVYGPSSP